MPFWNNPRRNNKNTHHNHPTVIIKRFPDTIKDSSELLRSGLTTAKRLPILFCVDVSGSMSRGSPRPIDLMNKAVNQFLTEIRCESEIDGAEVAFVTFANGIVDLLDFDQLNLIEEVRFHHVNDTAGTRMADAVIKSIEKMDERRSQLIQWKIEHYAPFLVIVTDGHEMDSPESAKNAQYLLQEHCRSHRGEGGSKIILPYVIGVGNEIHSETLKEYSKGFLNGAFHIRDSSDMEAFSAMFRLIGDSVQYSVNLNDGAIIKGIKDHVMEQIDDWDDSLKERIAWIDSLITNI